METETLEANEYDDWCAANDPKCPDPDCVDGTIPGQIYLAWDGSVQWDDKPCPICKKNNNIDIPF